MKTCLKKSLILASCLLASDAVLASKDCNALLVTIPDNATKGTVTNDDIKNAKILAQNDKQVLLERLSAWRHVGVIGNPLTVTVSMSKGDGIVQTATITQNYCFTQSGNINVSANRTPAHHWPEPKVSLADHGNAPGKVEFN